MTTLTLHAKTLRIDGKGRVSLGQLLYEGISGFKAFWDNKHRLVLEPLSEISAREKWLFEKPNAIHRLVHAHQQMKKGSLHAWKPESSGDDDGEL